VEWLRELEGATSGLHANVITAAPAALSVALTSRAQSRAFFNAIFGLSDGVPSGWTGSLSGTPGGPATGVAGTTTAAFQAAVQLRVNWFRAMAGLPAAIAFDSTEGGLDQQAALMMAANNALSHFPPTNWQVYTSAGATAAGNSNISIGVDGPGAIDGYIADAGSNNAEAGHRRWLLYPQTQTMGTGDVDATGNFSASNATWIMDGNYGGPRPTVRDSYIAWPPPGYVPYQVVFPRWSFAYPLADFSAATVTMTSNGAPIGVVLEPQSNNPSTGEAGENTLVWDYNGLDGNTVETGAPQPAADLPYTVQISGVKIGGQIQQPFIYTVTLFDPATAGPAETKPSVAGPVAPAVGQNSTYTVTNIPGFASGFQYRTVALGATSAFGAEGGLQGVIAAVSSAYNPVDSSVAGSGTASYYLAMPDGNIQTLTLPGKFTAINSAATLQFQSRLGLASTTQMAHVQLSLNDGVSWFDVYTQAGTNGFGESAFTTRSVALGTYVGSVFEIRFTFTVVSGSTFYPPQTNPGAGWHIDNISFTGASAATTGSANLVGSGSTFSFAPSATGAVALQASGVLFGTYPIAWGPLLNISAIVGGSPAITSQPISAAVTSGTTVVFNVTASNSPNYQWYLNGSAIAGATSARLVITGATAANAGSYTCIVTNGSGTATSTAATLAFVTTANPGRLGNISVNSNFAVGQLLTVGFVTGGAGTSGTQTLLIRADGPTLATFGLTGVMADPNLKVIPLGQSVATSSNDNWGTNSAAVTAADSATGAFPLSNGSLDAAEVATLSAGGYTVQVSGTGAGTALTELYDTTPIAAYTLTVPRLINVSCNTTLPTGASLTAGFTIGGTSNKTVLIRASGPTLTGFGLTGTMADPQIVVQALGATSILAANAGWGGDPQIAAAAVAVNAFAFASPSSKDSAVLLTLPPGGYTAVVNSVSGGGGTTVVEVYEVP
jgi:hypothetical protein